MNILKRILILFLITIFFWNPLFLAAQTNEKSKQDSANSKYINLPNTKKSYFWNPLFSFFLPGLGQYVSDRPAEGMLYSGLAISGYYLITNAKLENTGDGSNPQSEEFDPANNEVQKALVGNSLWMTGASLSLYQRFRDNASTWYRSGHFTYLDNGDSAAKAAASPFYFSYLGRWTSLIPLGLIATSLFAGEQLDYSRIRYRDAAFIGTVSYGAGVSEEALFRGWLMPVFQHNMGYDWMSNFFSSAIFGAAHYSGEKEVKDWPWPQFVLGLYLGWLTQRRNWSISEAVFIHTWWDIIAFTLTFAYTGKVKRSLYIPILFKSF